MECFHSSGDSQSSLYLGEAVWGRTKKRDKYGRLNLSRCPESKWIESPYLLSGFARCSDCGGSLGVLGGGRARQRVCSCARAYKTSSARTDSACRSNEWTRPC